MLIIAVNVFIYFMISSSHFYTAVTYSVKNVVSIMGVVTISDSVDWEELFCEKM